MVKHLSDTEVENVKKLYLSGDSIRTVASCLGVSKGQISNILHKNNVKVRKNLDWQLDNERLNNFAIKTKERQTGIPRDCIRRHLFDVNIFDKVDSDPFSSYMLGVIFTDGNVGKRCIRLQCSNGDSDWIENISNKFGVPYTIDSRGYPVFTLNSIVAVNKLISFGVLPNKTKNIVNIYIPKLKYDFIRGLIDGDGSIGNRTPSLPYVSFCGTNINIVELIANTFKEHGQKRAKIINCFESSYNLHSKRPYKDNFYRITCTGYPAISFLDSVYYINSFAMSRKYKKARSFIDDC